ncbi:MAG: phosphatidylinositol transfer protein [Deltaproteobacteria bacterium]|nr:phosphatidylinositol transfer protein [Deltaproteobacteria bacterium]
MPWLAPRSSLVATLALLGLVACSESEAGQDEGSSIGEEVGETGGDGDGEGETGTSEGETGETTGTTDTDTTDTDSESETDTSEDEGDPGFGPWCEAPPACDAPHPDPGPELDWEEFDTNITVLAGDPNHRIRDMFYVPGEPQWLLGKFTYGLTDKDLTEERVDVYVLRGCQGPWELLGSAHTTDDGQHPTVEGVEDSGGWVYFQIPEDEQLELGRHKVHMVVRGDLSWADGYVEVVEQGTPIFLSDVDGTLTTFESEEFGDFLLGEVPSANEFSATALGILQDKGFHAMYLTARPEWLVARTREFVEVRGYPPGIIHTSLFFDGATGDKAEAYKSGELAMLAGKGLVPIYVFGNTDSDAAAYHAANILPLENRVFFQFTDPQGGRRIESYGELIAEFEALADPCR